MLSADRNATRPDRSVLAKPLTVRPVSVIEAVSASLRERVLNGELVPGSPIREMALAAEYGVARPTIRAAIQRLVLTGLFRREANHSAFVPTLSEDDVRDLYSLRNLVESDVVRHVTESRLRPAAAELAVRRLESFTARAPWAEVVEADLAFHRALVAATNRPRLSRLFELLQDEIRLSISQLKPVYDTPAALADEHRQLLTTIESGKVEPAVALMRQHLNHALGYLAAPTKRVKARTNAAPRRRAPRAAGR